MKQIKTGNVIACEYAALGSHGKHTLVNVYTGDILVQKFPALIPIAFFFEIIPEPGMPNDLKIDVFQNKELKASLGAEFQFNVSQLGLAVLQQMPFSIAQNTEIKVVASCEGYKETTLIKKKVSVGPIPPG